MASETPSVPNLGSGLSGILERLKSQNTTRQNISDTIAGGARSNQMISDSGSESGVIKVTQVASVAQKWRIVGYVIMGAFIVAGVGVLIYWAFQSKTGKQAKDAVQNMLPFGNKRPKPTSLSQTPTSSQQHSGPVPPPPIPYSAVALHPQYPPSQTNTIPSSYPPQMMLQPPGQPQGSMPSQPSQPPKQSVESQPQPQPQPESQSQPPTQPQSQPPSQPQIQPQPKPVLVPIPETKAKPKKVVRKVKGLPDPL